MSLLLTLFIIIAIIIHFFTYYLTLSSSSSSGEWHLLHESIGISAMHMQLLNEDKLVIFDRTDFGPSNLSLPAGNCRHDPLDTALPIDCTAHSIIYDLRSNNFRPLTILTDTWCSSGSILPNGTLLQTGGYNDGDRTVRSLAAPCNDATCDWVEFPNGLVERRWYASNQILPDGRVIIVGGRSQFNYEIYPSSFPFTSTAFTFLRETKDRHENNLYPFLHLLPDGNLFVFANRKSVLLDYRRNVVVRDFPEIPDRYSRNYPSSGSSVLLPVDENAIKPTVEVMICGGAPHNAVKYARKGRFLKASSTCGRLRISDEDPAWKMEKMPMGRVMGDMLLLPDGDVIIINGAGAGSAGWGNARDPVLAPLIYRLSESAFVAMAVAGRPRLYHSTAVLLSDGRVLVGGSNPHVNYDFTGVDFPTDLSLESFSPPYLLPEFDLVRPRVVRLIGNPSYKTRFEVIFTVAELREESGVSVRIVAPPFNTHSFSMNQRMVVLKGIVGISRIVNSVYRVEAYGPSTPEIAPPGYYLLFLVHVDIPSSGIWVKIQ